MFKSAFAKYLTAFIVILLISFTILTGIVTTIIRSYVAEENVESLEITSRSIAAHIERMNVQELEKFVNSGYGSVGIIPILNQGEDAKILILDSKGKILLSTVVYKEVDGIKVPMISPEDGDLGAIDMSVFEADQEGTLLLFKGKMSVIGKDKYHVTAVPIITENVLRGYSVCLMSTDAEDEIVLTARKSIINSSLWVMLAAVVAVYLITERVINPLKNMTKATKSFAKGDFSARVTVTGHDEIAELGESFNNMAEALDNFEKMRNSFLANVSHDLRTPMTTISGFIDGITSGAIPPEKHEYYLGVISSEVHRLSRLVSELLDISRLESGERKFNFESFDVAEMARIILISFEQKIGDKKLDVVFECENDVMIAYADKDAIYQVLYNLMHNAIKFSNEKGKLAISITRQNKKLRVSVYNEGPGIAKEDLSLVFDRFYKTDKSRGLDKSGVGLGLYICKTIIDAHGETIVAESPAESGAEFWFTLKEDVHYTKTIKTRTENE